MTGARITEEELSAYIDGELPHPRAEAVARALQDDVSLAARADAYRHDRDRLRAAYAPVAQAALPADWLHRIQTAVERPASSMQMPAKRRPAFRSALAWAIAACLALAVGLGVSRLRLLAPEDALLAQALEARAGALAPAARIAHDALPDDAAQRVLLARATGLPVRTPDLRRQGWHLTEMDIYGGAASLRYANGAGQNLFVFVRRSAGAPRFDILKRRNDRVCIWQDEVVAAVMIGDMTAGQMMRVAGAAYASLDL